MVNNTLTVGFWRSLTCQNSHGWYQPTGQTWLIDIYAILPRNASFLECFWRSHVYFIRYCNKPTEITRNHFCDIFLENQKYLREMFLRRLRGVTEKTSFLRYARDVLKTLHKRHLFWDVFETSQRLHKKDIFFEMYLRGLWDISLNGDRIESLRDIWCRLG